MLFNSSEFIIFFIAVVGVVSLLKEQNLAKKIFLIAASLFFYMHWKTNYVWLLAGSILFNHFFAQAIGLNESPGSRKALVFLAVAGNLILLSIFKYTNFIIGNINALLGTFHGTKIGLANITLPIGISFFTFQAICYVVDVYRRKIRPAGLVNTSLYISFFPHLIAGPIIRADNIMPQFEKAEALQRDNMIAGGNRIFWGLIKKMVVADNLAIFVNQVFGNYQQYDALTLILAVYAFAFQIYGDFSGYSDIAIGCFRILGYRIPENFNLPYVASSFSDFWKRWHISLSTWLKDYLYIPLGGNRYGAERTYANLMITMFLGGLWHGAKWTFVIWGALHGAYLVGQKLLEKKIVLPDRPIVNFAKVFCTFQLVCFAWIFFRAESFSAAFGIIASIFTLKGGQLFFEPSVLIILLSFAALHFVKSRFHIDNFFMSMPYYVKYFAYSVGAFLLFFNKASISSQFIYFQF